MCIVNCAIPQFHMHGQDRFHFIDPAALCFNGQSVALNQNVFKNQTLVSSFRKCNKIHTTIQLIWILFYYCIIFFQFTIRIKLKILSLILILICSWRLLWWKCGQILNVYAAIKQIIISNLNLNYQIKIYSVQESHDAFHVLYDTLIHLRQSWSLNI